MSRWFVLPLLPLSLPGAPVAAQSTFSGPLSPGAFESTLNIDPVSNTLRSQAPDAAPPPANRDAPASTRFVRDPALLSAKEAQIVAAMRAQSPEAAAELERLFSRDILALVTPELRRMGLDPQDMADMTAVYWIAAWEAAHGIVGRPTDPAIARGARDQMAATLRANPMLQRMSDRDKQDLADTMLLQTIFVEARMQGAAQGGATARQQMSDTIHAEAKQLLRTDLRAVTLTAAGFAPASGSAPPPANAAPPAAGNAGAALPGAAHADNWAQVEGVYFKAYTSFGVGGMVTVDYEPLVLFRDGSYYEIEGDALEDVDLAASRHAKPIKWGRWARAADGGFTLTDSRGRASQTRLQGGSFFKAFPAEASGNRLAAKYSRVSGGGNSALGGELTIAAKRDLTFAADGRYMSAGSAGAIGSGDISGVGTATYSRRPPGGVGRYRIERYTITLTEPNGQARRQFFAFGSHHTPAQLDTDMIFVGDRVFVIMDD